MQRSRRNHKAAFKAKVAIAAIKGDQTVRSSPSASMFIPTPSFNGNRSCSNVRLKPSEATAPRIAAPTSRICMPRSASWRWRTIF